MKKYYLQLFSPHGLIRGHNPEIGRDKDTGGQVKYVLELLEALSLHPQIRKVDLITRLIDDKRVAPSYSKKIEVINEKANIIRIACGGTTYRAKETLWKHLDEMVDKVIRFNKEQNDIPDIVHGHYADGNYVAMQLSQFFQIPLISTGHSLGRNKLNILKSQGLSHQKINEKFKIDTRIKVEEAVLAKAEFVITSTQHEIDDQYEEYDSFSEAEFKVIPPGIRDDLFYPFYRQSMPGFSMTIEQEQALYRISAEIDRFLFDSSKPLILSIGRPDKRKNFETIIEAYGKDKELQALANLAIFAGVRKDISMMPDDEQEILTNLLLLMDKYDLYGKLAIPKKNDPKLEIPEIYRIAARKNGIFINATPGENFGLTVIEAAACGLPVIASPSGGPKEILEKCENGILVDVENPQEIATAIKKIITDKTQWETYSSNGIKSVDKFYSWNAHTKKLVQLIDDIFKNKPSEASSEKINIGEKMLNAAHFFITDLDGTLIQEMPDKRLEEFKTWLPQQKEKFVFGIATGRNKELTREAIEKFELPEPDIIICSAGSELYYTKDFIPDSGWYSYISYQWKRQKLEDLMTKFPKIKLQETNAQWKFKLSYYVDETFNEDDLANLYQLLDTHRLKANILLTDNLYLDFLPIRASKGNALKYLSYKWHIPLDKFITAGNGGNDIDMLRGKTNGIVVANYSPELEVLRKQKKIYFAQEPLAAGILEGIEYYLKK
jgi:sucrose-phosphate synthase